MTIGITQRRVWPAPARAGARRGATQQKENRAGLREASGTPESNGTQARSAAPRSGVGTCPTGRSAAGQLKDMGVFYSCFVLHFPEICWISGLLYH